LGFFGGNGLILSRENYPDRPFWLAKVGFDGLKLGKGKAGVFEGTGSAGFMNLLRDCALSWCDFKKKSESGILR